MQLRTRGCAAIIIAVLLSTAGARAQDATQPNWTKSVVLGLHFVDWSGNRGDVSGVITKGSGEEEYLPMSLSASGTEDQFKFDALISSGVAWAHQSSPKLSGSISTLTDTVLSGTVTDLGIDGVQPFLSLNLNLPTGQSALYGLGKGNARMDPDIVDVPGFGEGFNTGLTVGANIPIQTNLVATVSAAHIWRGDFDREGIFATPQSTINMHPGDVTSVDASLAYQATDWYLQGAFTYVTSQTVKSDGVPAIKPGDSYSASFSFVYQLSTAWSAETDFSWSYALKNQLNGGSGLVTEPDDSNSNSFSVTLSPTYSFTGGSIGPQFSFLYRDHNAYRPLDNFFSPAKTRVSAGAVGTLAVRDDVSVSLSAGHIWTNERFMPFAPGVPVVAKSAWNVALTTTVSL